jgi:hypothetical protein
MAPSTQAVAAVQGILSAALSYHKSSQLAPAIVAGIADPHFKARRLALGVEANPPTSGAFDQFIAPEISKWAKVIQLPISSRGHSSQRSVTSNERTSQRNVAFARDSEIL